MASPSDSRGAISAAREEENIFECAAPRGNRTLMDDLPFEILPSLLSHGAAFYEGSETVNVVAEADDPNNVRTLKVRGACE